MSRQSFMFFSKRNRKRKMPDEFIQSAQNPRVKSLARLRDRQGRRKLGLFVVEGLRELSRGVEKIHMREIYFCPEFFKSPQHSDFVERVRSEGKIPLCRLSETAFKKASNREGCDGVMGVALQWGNSLADLRLPDGKPAAVLVADAVEKPGNLGAILRSADALGADAVILTNPVSDVFNPAVVRASQGALFSLQIAEASVPEAAQWLRRRNIAILGAHLGADKFIWQCGGLLNKSVAVVVGSENHGLGGDWDSELDGRVKIPVSGVSDSLNVNVAAALCLYEVLRTRSL